MATPHPTILRWLAAALRERREALGPRATQEEIAYKAGVTLRQLQKIEKAQANPRVGTLLGIAAALQTNLQSLLDRAEELQRARKR